MNPEFHVGQQTRFYNYNFRQALEAVGWSQRDLAAATGITEHRISALMTFRQYPHLEEQVLIAKALGIEDLESLWPVEIEGLKLVSSPPDRVISVGDFAGLEPADDGQMSELIDKADADSILDDLSKSYPRLALVIRHRFGLRVDVDEDDGQQPNTLKEVGDNFGVSRDRIRQLETKGFMHIRRCQAFKLRAVNRKWHIWNRSDDGR